MKTAVIVNPVAGRGKSYARWDLLKRELLDHKLYVDEFITKARGMATDLARYIQKAGYTRLMVAGGDGTLHEVINGLDLPANLEIGILPTGTGNDFARAVGLAYEKKLALRLMNEGRTRLIDLGEVNQRKFVNIAGVGFDAQVAHEVNSGFKFVSGTAAYLMALVKVMLTYQSLPIDIYINDDIKKTEEILFFTVANAPYIGGGMKIVPQAVIDDGLFHICLAQKVSRLEIFKTLPKIYHGKHIEHPKVHIITARELRLSSIFPLPLHADGELLGALPAYFRVLPRSLLLLVPGKD